MSRNRMFGDDEPANPSPRTTIVGGQPPQAPADLPPVPTGIQRLLRLASVDPEFARELGERRAGIAAAAGVELTASEAAILRAIPAAQLEAMVRGLPPPEEDRRSFLRQTAATAVMLLGGAALAACDRADRRMQAPGGAAPDVPPPEPPGPTKGIRPDVPPPRPDLPPPAPAGARIDVPPAPDAGADAPPRPPQPHPTRGIRPDRPQVHTAGIRPDHLHPTRGATIEIPPTRDGKVDPFDK